MFVIIGFFFILMGKRCHVVGLCALWFQYFWDVVELGMRVGAAVHVSNCDIGISIDQRCAGAP